MANGIIGKVTAGGGTHLVTSTFYGTCATAAGTAAKIVKLADATADAATAMVGMTLAVKFTYSNTSTNPTLTVQRNGNTTNLIAAASIKSYGTTAPGTTAATSWRAGAVVLFVYVADGSNYYWTQVSSLDDNTTYSSQAAASGGTALSLVTTGEKYTWNNKSTLAIGTTATTAAAGNHTHGNIQNGGTLQTNDITIANGDKLIVTDSSDSSKIARTSISFDASTATKALTQKGTWESFLPIGGGTLTGVLTTTNPASTATSNTTAGVRNISYGTGAPSGGANGDIYIQYS